MKSFVACLLVCALFGSATCASRYRRQAEATDLAGAPGGLTTPGKTMVKSMDDVMPYAMGDLNNQAGMGVPINPKVIGGIMTGGSGVGAMGLKVANPSKESIAGLQTAPPKVVDNEPGAP